MTIRIEIIIAFVIATCVSSCGNNTKDTKANSTDSLAEVNTIKTADSTMIASKELDKWIATTLHRRSFDWNRLHLEEYAHEEKHEQEPFTPPANFFNDYAEVMRWSPDSSYVLDIGSYGSVLVKDKKGKTHVEAGEPDTEISLINIKSNQKRSLFFVGPSSVIIDGAWADTSNALILGSFDEKGNNKPDTLFWLINVNDNFYRMYKWKR